MSSTMHIKFVKHNGDVTLKKLSSTLQIVMALE